MKTQIVGQSSKIIQALKSNAFGGKYAECSSSIANCIHVSPKFYLGERSDINNSSVKEKPTRALMPYDSFVLEYSSQYTNQDGTLVLCDNVALLGKAEDSFVILHFQCFKDNTVYAFTYSATVKDDDRGRVTRAFNPFNVSTIKQSNSQQSVYERHMLDVDIALLVNMAEILECSNVSIETTSGGSKKTNAKRRRSGKLPMFEYKILVVDGDPSKAGLTGGVKKEDCRTRLHLRRGHVRHHKTAGSIWVRQCVVGRAECGVIKKDYSVRNR